MSVFVLKIIATIAMVLNHLSYLDDRFIIPLFYIGRMAFPIFAFCIVEGYVHTRSFKKYLTRILVFAVVSQVPFYFFLKTYNSAASIFYLNALFTFALGLISLKLFDTIKAKYKKPKALGIVLGIIPAILLAVVAEFLKFDYGLMGVGLVVLFYLCRNHKSIAVWVYTLFVTACLSRNLITSGNNVNLDVNAVKNILYQLLGYELGAALFSIYNNKKCKDGKKVRLFFYFFYPIHFILLLLLVSIIK